MAKYRDQLPLANGGVFLSYVGMGTDLIFNRGVDLPGFADFPLVMTESGRAILEDYFTKQIELAASKNLGIFMEGPTWKASRDHGIPLGYSPDEVLAANVSAIELMAKVRAEQGDLPTILSAQVGPRDDAYAPSEQMTIEDAESYHAEQITVLATTEADLISAFTLCYAEEAAGIALAAKKSGMPIVIAFTVETDGRLPTGMTMPEAITLVDEATDKYPLHYLINCAHPDHFSAILTDEEWMPRLKGIVVNASRCSHAELDNAEELDDGDPVELGRQLGELKRKFPHMTVFGGCCGTDMRHMNTIADNVSR